MYCPRFTGYSTLQRCPRTGWTNGSLYCFLWWVYGSESTKAASASAQSRMISGRFTHLGGIIELHCSLVEKHGSLPIVLCCCQCVPVRLRPIHHESITAPYTHIPSILQLQSLTSPPVYHPLALHQHQIRCLSRCACPCLWLLRAPQAPLSENNDTSK